MTTHRLDMASAVLIAVAAILRSLTGDAAAEVGSGRVVPAGDLPCHVTQAQYDQLRVNMTIDDVRKIFRCTGELKRSSDKFGTRYELYEYAGPREGSGVFADFQNSRLQDKVSVDLN